MRASLTTLLLLLTTLNAPAHAPPGAVAQVAAGAAAGAESSEGAWSNWRGPRSSGQAAGAPPIEWAEDHNVAWKTKVPGLGSATPVVWGERIFVLTAIAGDTGDAVAAEPADPAPAPRRGRRGRGPAVPTSPIDWAVIAYDAANGSELWRRVARSQVPFEGKQINNSYASASAITDGERLWAFFGSYGLYCFDLDGNLLWDRDFGAMHTRNSFGEGASPAIHGDNIVVVWDQEEQSWIGAFDNRTGEERWRVDRDEPTTWATPLIVEYDGVVQVITAGTRRVRSYDLSDGRLLWEGPGLTLNAIPSPIYEDGVVYLTSGYRGSALMAVDLSRAHGRIDDTEAVLWRIERDTPYVPSPLLAGGVIYFIKSNSPVLSAVRAATGEKVFGPQRVDGLREVYASPVAANGYLYLLGRDGGATVLRLGAEYQVAAHNVLDDAFDASPVVIGDSLLLRGRQWMYRIAVTDDD